MRALVPAYFDPSGNGLKYWNGLLAAAGSVPITAVANPNDGPGSDREQNYTDVIARAADAGVKVRKAAELGVGNVYVTDDKMPNPWDRLPKYWEKEVQFLR